MNTACPTDDRLKSLICEAFDELSNADAARLGQIGNKISKKAQCNKPHRPKIQHWLFWLLFGASITAAAWWSNQYLSEEKEVLNSAIFSQPIISHEKVESDPPISNQSKSVAKESTPISSRNSPIIDRRERY